MWSSCRSCTESLTSWCTLGVLHSGCMTVTPPKHHLLLLHHEQKQIMNRLIVICYGPHRYLWECLRYCKGWIYESGLPGVIHLRGSTYREEQSCTLLYVWPPFLLSCHSKLEFPSPGVWVITLSCAAMILLHFLQRYAVLWVSLFQGRIRLSSNTRIVFKYMASYFLSNFVGVTCEK